jgi:hypothetical protein
VFTVYGRLYIVSAPVRLPPLVLKSTNLYSDRDGFGYGPTTDGHFPVDGKITFSFVTIPDGAKASATFDDGVYASATIAGNTVTVAPALLTPNEDYAFTLRIVRSAAEPYTLYESPPVPVEDPEAEPLVPKPGVVGPLYINGTVDAPRIAFKTAPSELVPVSTNLYTDRSGFVNEPGLKPYFPADSDIEITFADIPEGAIAKATFDGNIYASATIVGNTVTIAPAQLTPGTKHFTLDIIKGTAILYRTEAPETGNTLGPLYIDDNADSNPSISFTPATATGLALISTNLYVDRGGIQKTPVDTALFPGSEIEFTFDALPLSVVIVAELKEDGVTTAIPITTVQTGNTITITPIQLKRNTKYSLSLEILSSGSQRTLYTSPLSLLWDHDDDSGTPMVPIAGVVGPLYINVDDLIEFTTAAVEPLADLISTNLYIDPATTVDAGANSPTNVLYYFAPDGDIELTFGSPIPAGAVIDVLLKDGTYNTIKTTSTSTGSILTINPVEDLKPAALYYLSVKIVDTKNGEYWKVPDDSTVAAIDDYFAAGTGLLPQNDPANYIGFSTQTDQKARLVSTNLYQDGDVANYATHYFGLKDVIELQFADIPQGAKIDYVTLSEAPGLTSPLGAYYVLDANNKVTITPNDALTPGTPYYLDLALSKTVAGSVWSVKSETGDDDINGSVYINVDAGFSEKHAIVFNTVELFKIEDTSNFDISNTAPSSGAGTFGLTNSIKIVFNQPIATVTKAQLQFYRDSEYYGVTASVDETNKAANLSLDKKVLTIPTTNLLAPDETFVIRLNVISEDGQQIVYDSTNPGDPTAWANSGTPGDLRIRTDPNALFESIAKQPIGGGTLRAEPSGAVNLANTQLDLSFTAPQTSFAQTYTVYAWKYGLRVVDGGVFTPVVTPSIPAGPVSAITLNNVAIPGPAAVPHVTAENLQYRARAVNNSGYVVEVVAAITFTTS